MFLSYAFKPIHLKTMGFTVKELVDTISAPEWAISS
jgi:hypothetical protein